MTSTNLPWRLRGRLLRPFAFAVSLATAVLSYAVLAGVAIGQLLDNGPGCLVGVAGVAAVVCLWVGWWVGSERCMRWGLFWTTGVWSAAATVLAVDVGIVNVNTALAGCWAVAAGGAWLLEASNPREP